MRREKDENEKWSKMRRLAADITKVGHKSTVLKVEDRRKCMQIHLAALHLNGTG